ncbi:hypothetical protein [Streptomyces erythrochromogenes]|uniref:hypothetical protein n=1 Tax=Streptomyces erythrochromogenes TaxID=285574 RepID=UPI0033F46541
MGLEAYTTAGEVSLLLYWERGSQGFRYVAKESRGVRDGVKLTDMQLKTVTTLVTESEVTDPFEYGECGCEDPEEVDDPRVCIEHAYCPARLDARFGWGSEVTRNYELAGWGEDGGTGGQYSLRVEPVEGQVELTLADVIPAKVRRAVIPGMPEPTYVGDCGIPVADGFNGYCDAYGVRLYLVGTRRDGRLMCADHAAQRAGVPVSALPVLAMDADERRYAEDCIEDNRQHRVLRGAEEWAEAREEERRSISHAFEGWAEKNWTGDDFAAAYVAWLHTTGHAADPVHAWAVTGPVDRVQQAEVRLEAARPTGDRSGLARLRAALRRRDRDARGVGAGAHRARHGCGRGRGPRRGGSRARGGGVCAGRSGRRRHVARGGGGPVLLRSAHG